MKYVEIEAVVEKGKVKKEEIKKILEKIGTSLVIGEITNYYKIHIHTNFEDKVVERIKKIGKVIDLRKIPLP